VGELAPKSIALQNPEGTSLVVAQPTLWTERIFKPIIWLLNGAGNTILKWVGVVPASGHQLVHSVEELRMIVNASAEGGTVEEDKHEMLVAIFDFGELLVRQVMIPRTEIIAVEADSGLEEIIQLVSESTYTKIPIYEDNLDQIIGIVHVKDLLSVMQKPDCTDCIARDLAREAMYIPETASVSTLLEQFRFNRQHIAIVMDEYGGTAGLITLEDLLEEIVGEVSDQFDNNQPEIRKMPDGVILVDGLTLIEDVNSQLNIQLQDEDYDTIAGYVMGKIGRIPMVGDEIESENLRFSVVDMDGMRIQSLAIRNKPPGKDNHS